MVVFLRFRASVLGEPAIMDEKIRALCKALHGFCGSGVYGVDNLQSGPSGLDDIFWLNQLFVQFHWFSMLQFAPEWTFRYAESFGLFWMESPRAVLLFNGIRQAGNIVFC